MNSELAKRILRTVFVTIFMSGLIMMLGLVNQSIVGKTYGAMGVGIYATALMVIRLLVIFSLFGLPIAFSRWVAQLDFYKNKNEISSNFSLLIFFSTVMTIFITLFMLLAQNHINTLLNVQWESVNYLFLGTATLLYGYARLSQTLFEGLLEPVKSTIINISLLFSIFCALFYSIFVTSVSIFNVVIFGFIVMGLTGVILVSKSSLWTLKVKENKFRELLIFSSPVTFVIFLGFLGQWSDRLILNQTLGLREVGIYTAALSLFEAGRKIPMSLAPALMPIYSKLDSLNSKQLEKGLNKTISFNYIFLFFVASLIYVNAEYLVLLIYSEEFTRAVIVLKILSLQIPLSAFTMTSSSLINGINKPKLNSYISINGVVVQLLLVFILTYYYGLIGTAIGQVLSSLVNLSFIYWIFTKHISLKIYYIKLLKPTIIFILIIVLFLLMQIYTFIHPMNLLISQGLVGLMIIWFMLIDKGDKMKFKKFFTRK